MWGALGREQKPSRLAAGKRPLLGAVALGALILPGAASSVAWGQASATLPEVTVTAPRTKPRPARRTEPTARRTVRAPSERSEPVPAATPTPAPSALPALQVVAPTPITGPGLDRNKGP